MAPHDKTRFIAKTAPQDDVKRTIQNADCYCFDVDSTMLTGEGIDELAKFADKSEEVKALTRKAMGGNMSFRNSLEQRLGIIQPSLEMIGKLVKERPFTITPGFQQLVNTLKNRGTDIYLVSGGFHCMINPAAERCGISPANVIANRIIFDETGKYADFDRTCFTSETMGKARALKHLKDTHKYERMIMIGDGMTDSEARPPADLFIGFGGNVRREEVRKVSDWYVTSFASILDVINEA